MIDQPIIIIDTREQQPWSFEYHTTSVAKLDTGDYSIQGLENKLCIERKKTVNEFANNIIEKRYKDWTKRMSKYKYKFLILEFNLEDIYKYPHGSNVPKYLWDQIKISPKFIIKNILELQIYYDIKVLFCGSSDNAEKLALSIINKVYNLENQNNI